MTSDQIPLASFEINISRYIVIIMRNSLTPRRNLSLRDSDFFLLDFFRCFFSIMIGSDVPEFNSLIDSPTKPFEEDRLCSPQALMVWASSIWFCHLTLQTTQISSRSSRDYHTIRKLNAYQASPDPKPLISVLQESCPHTKAIDKLPWMGFRKINLSIDSRFYCNLDKLVIGAVWDYGDRSMTNEIWNQAMLSICIEYGQSLFSFTHNRQVKI